MCLMNMRWITRDFVETVELELKAPPGWRGSEGSLISEMGSLDE